MTAAAQIAALQFRRRQQFWQRKVTAGAATTTDANEALRPWLCVAALAGADLPQLHTRCRPFFPFGAAEVESTTRADDIHPVAEALWVLASARDLAVLAAERDPARTDDARQLDQLAHALAAPRMMETTFVERKAA